MKKLYPRICSNCGRRFLGNKMEYRCQICINNERVTIEKRAIRNSELGSVMRSVEWRGQRVIGCRAVGQVSHI